MNLDKYINERLKHEHMSVDEFWQGYDEFKNSGENSLDQEHYLQDGESPEGPVIVDN